MPQAGNRVAIVEDDPTLRALLRSTLTVKGYQVDLYENGAAALLALSTGALPDLVISDVQMPQLDGISLCKALREHHGKSRLPILMVSALSGEDDILAGLEAGANDYLIKPFAIGQVLAKVKYYLQRDAPPLQQGPLEHHPSAFPFEFEKYDLLEVLGRGSFGKVYQAKRRSDGLLVALKLLNFGIQRDREVLGRYFREVSSLARLQVPHVVQYIASGFERGRYFLVMELVTGDSAWSLLRRRGTFDRRQIARLGGEICEALAGLEAAGLVHRDIKPGNIVIDAEGGSTLVDFGLAKAPGDHTLTNAHEFMGTAEYIAPEIAVGRVGTIGSDLYSLGATLFQLATGSPPFDGESPEAILRQAVRGGPPPTLKSVRPDTPQELSDLIGSLLVRDPKARLADPVEAGRRFASLLDAC